MPVNCAALDDGFDQPVANLRRSCCRPTRSRPTSTVSGFAVGLRGYRMDQVDQVLDDLRDQLATKDRKIADLGAELGRRRQGPERAP